MACMEGWNEQVKGFEDTMKSIILEAAAEERAKAQRDLNALDSGKDDRTLVVRL